MSKPNEENKPGAAAFSTGDAKSKAMIECVESFRQLAEHHVQSLQEQIHLISFDPHTVIAFQSAWEEAIASMGMLCERFDPERYDLSALPLPAFAEDRDSPFRDE